MPQQLELDGLLRCLRIYNRDDPIPTVPSRSFGFGRRRRMEHTGIGLRLRNRGIDRPSHSGVTPTGGGGLARFLFFFGKKRRYERQHGLDLHRERLRKHAADLDSIVLDDLYGDEAVVDRGFLGGKLYRGYHNDEEQELSNRVRY